MLNGCKRAGASPTRSIGRTPCLLLWTAGVLINDRAYFYRLVLGWELVGGLRLLLRLRWLRVVLLIVFRSVLVATASSGRAAGPSSTPIVAGVTWWLFSFCLLGLVGHWVRFGGRRFKVSFILF